MQKYITKFMKRRLMPILLGICIVFGLNCSSVHAATTPAIVVIVDIVSYPGGFSAPAQSSSNGHSFLLIHNYSYYPITIGHMTVGVGDYITNGTFDNRSAHHGIWYNIEAYAINAVKQTTYARMSYGLTSQSQVDTLNSTINSCDYYSYVPLFTCSSFARQCWNSVAPSSMQVSGNTPLLLKSSILSHGGVSSGLTDSPKADSTIAYQTTTGYITCPQGKNEF